MALRHSGRREQLGGPGLRLGLLAALLLALVLALGLLIRPASASDISANYTWKPLKIGGGGFVTGITSNAAGDTYARTDVGGAWKWNETSQSWTQLLIASNVPTPTNGSDYGVESLGVSQSNSQIVYMAAGDQYLGDLTAPQVGRVLKSTDKGATWADSGQRWFMAGNGDYRTGGERLAVDPQNPNVVYFGSRVQGLWSSTTGASSWSAVPSTTIPYGNNNVGVKFVLFDQTSPVTNTKTSRIYVGVTGEGVYRSDDAGLNWSHIYTATDANQVPNTGQVASDGTLYLAFSDTVKKYSPTTGVFTDIKPANDSSFDIAVDPFNPQRIFAAPGGVADGHFYRSLNGGTSWDTLNVQLSSPDIPWVTATNEENYLSTGKILFDPVVHDRLWYAQGIATWRSSDLADNEVTWTNVSKGLEETDTTDLVVPPGGKPVSTIFDRQGFYHADPDAYPTKPLVDQTFQGGTSVNYSGGQPNFLVTAQVANNAWPNPGRGAYSSDGGQNWTLFPGLPGGDPNNNISEGGNIAVSANDINNIVWLPSTHLFGQGKPPYYSDNKGTSWSASTGITTTKTHWLFWWASKKVLDADKVTGGKFYVVSFENDGEFYVSTDGGHTFPKAANAPRCALNDDCHVFGQLKAVPGKANHVWSSDAKGGLYYTTDAGATPWTKVAGVQTAYAFGFGATLPGANYPTVFMSGMINNQPGVWRSTDQGATWDLVAAYPAGVYDGINVVTGDMNVPGRVYVGFGGMGFVYGDTPICQASLVTTTGDADVCGTLRHAVNYANNPANNSPTITLTLTSPATITVSNAITLENGVKIVAGLSGNGAMCAPLIEVKPATGYTGNGLVLKGNNTLEGMWVHGFQGKQLTIQGTGNRLRCMKIGPGS